MTPPNPTARKEGEVLLALAERVLAGSGCDNSLDVLIEVALFKPDDEFVSIRANAAGTKVICTTAHGTDVTFWAQDWTHNRLKAATELRALSPARLQEEDK